MNDQTVTSVEVSKILDSFKDLIKKRLTARKTLCYFIRSNAKFYRYSGGYQGRWLLEQVDDKKLGALTDKDLIRYCQLMIDHFSPKKEGTSEIN